MVKLDIYLTYNQSTIVIPKTILKTVELSKLTLEIPVRMIITSVEHASESLTSVKLSHEKEQERNFYIKFWKEFLTELDFDNPGQPIHNHGTAQILYTYLGNT